MKYKNKKTLAIALCASIFFACLSASFNTVTEFESLGHATNHMKPVRSAIHSWQNYSWESIERITQRNCLSEQYITRNHSRVPMRMPVPPILVLGCFLLLCYSKRRTSRQGDFFLHHNTSSYIIRYIHNQDGEIYHPFLF